MAGGLACAMLCCLNQIRSLHEASFLSLISMVTILFVLIIILIHQHNHPKEDIHREYFVDDMTIWDIFGGYSSIFFAFVGHTIYIEVIYFVFLFH
jgi:uncharacterized membrane protein YdcZ (DUF606 family)